MTDNTVMVYGDKDGGSMTTFTFAVYPADLSDRFESFLMDVPTLSGEAFAARRAYWTAFHMLGARGVDVEEFAVCKWDTERNAPGPAVGMGGYYDA